MAAKILLLLAGAVLCLCGLGHSDPVPRSPESGRFMPIFDNSVPGVTKVKSGELHDRFPSFPLPWSILLPPIPGVSGGALFNENTLIPLAETKNKDGSKLGFYTINPLGFFAPDPAVGGGRQSSSEAIIASANGLPQVLHAVSNTPQDQSLSRLQQFYQPYFEVYPPAPSRAYDTLIPQPLSLLRPPQFAYPQLSGEHLLPPLRGIASTGEAPIPIPHFILHHDTRENGQTYTIVEKTTI